MNDYFSRFARSVNAFCASPLATSLVLLTVVVWGATGPRFHYSNTWQLVMNTTSSIVTFMMVFIIANAQKRDTDAFNLKLDMLIAADHRLSNKAVGLEAAPLERAAEVRQELDRVIEETEGVLGRSER
jgi:low affinity Fe/Cu permease